MTVLLLALTLIGPVDPPLLRVIDRAPDAVKVPSRPLPPEHPALRLTEIRVKDGDTIAARVTLEAGISVVLPIRLAGSEGDVDALMPPDHGRAGAAQHRLEELLTGGPFWVELTGDRTPGGAWIARVYRQVTVDVASPQGIQFESRIEDVGDRMRAEGLGVAK